MFVRKYLIIIGFLCFCMGNHSLASVIVIPCVKMDNYNRRIGVSEITLKKNKFQYVKAITDNDGLIDIEQTCNKILNTPFKPRKNKAHMKIFKNKNVFDAFFYLNYKSLNLVTCNPMKVHLDYFETTKSIYGFYTEGEIHNPYMEDEERSRYRAKLLKRGQRVKKHIRRQQHLSN